MYSPIGEVVVTYEMDVADIRRVVLRSIISSRFNGVARQLALSISRSEGQINDMLCNPPRKSFGEKIARSIEVALDLPPGYLDDSRNSHASDDRLARSPLRTAEPHPLESVVHEEKHSITQEERILLEAYRVADARLRRIMLASAREVIESFNIRTEVTKKL